jgi:hypothetical protein
MAIVEQILAGDESGTVNIGPTAFIGVLLAEDQGPDGVTLSGTVDDTPADKAGLVDGDTITHFAGTPVFTVDELKAAVATFEPGDEVEITIIDSRGDVKTLQSGLAERTPHVPGIEPQWCEQPGHAVDHFHGEGRGVQHVMVRRTQQHPVVDVGRTALCVFEHVMGMTPTGRGRAVHPDAAPVAHGESAALGSGKESFSVPEVEYSAVGAEHEGFYPRIAG